MNAEIKKLGPLAEIVRFDNNSESTVYGYLKGCYDNDGVETASYECDNYVLDGSSKIYVPDGKQRIFFSVRDSYVVICEWDDLYDSFVICRPISDGDIDYIVQKIKDLDELLYKTFYFPGETPKKFLMRAIEGAESRKYDYAFHSLRTRLEAITL
jgi:hypothetical protein